MTDMTAFDGFPGRDPEMVHEPGDRVVIMKGQQAGEIAYVLGLDLAYSTVSGEPVYWVVLPELVPEGFEVSDTAVLAMDELIEKSIYQDEELEDVASV